MVKDNEMKIPCSLNPDVECPPECANHRQLMEMIGITLKILATRGILTDPEGDYQLLQEILKGYLLEGKPNPSITASCFKNKNK